MEKKMKILFIYIFLFVLLFNKQDATAQIDCYNLNNCENVQWNSTWLDIFYPPYPTCKLTVEIRTRICNGKTQVQVSGIHFYDPFSDCNSIIAWLWPNGW